jgi:hypothetical protein
MFDAKIFPPVLGNKALDDQTALLLAAVTFVFVVAIALLVHTLVLLENAALGITEFDKPARLVFVKNKSICEFKTKPLSSSILTELDALVLLENDARGTIRFDKPATLVFVKNKSV